MIQGSEEWKMARCGSLGASVLHEVVAKTKSGWAASRANRLSILAIEILTGQPHEMFQTPAMVAGTEREPEARALYEFMTNVEVEQIGLAVHPTIAGTHASPDGLVSHDGMIEIKSPQPAQHMATLRGEPVQAKYVTQMQWQMRCCDRSWCDFISFNPDFPASMQMFTKRFHRDDERIAELEAEVVKFLREVRETVEDLRRRYEPEEEPFTHELMAG